MRIALALGLCLVAVAAVAAPRGEGDAKPQAPAPTETQRENYRVRMNENVVGSPNGTDLGIAYDIAQAESHQASVAGVPLVETVEPKTDIALTAPGRIEATCRARVTDMPRVGR